jgi:hypothetical protein
MLGCNGLKLSSVTRGIQEFYTQQMRLHLQELTKSGSIRLNRIQFGLRARRRTGSVTHSDAFC